MTIKKYFSIFCLFAIVVSICGCSNEKTISVNESGGIENTKDLKESDSKEDDSVNLVWLTDSTWVDDVSESRKNAINNRIHELGYNYSLSFYGINSDTYKSYQRGIDKAKKEGKGDLMWTGLGDGENPEEDGTYIRQIKKGNLLSLNTWLKSEDGEKLKKEYGKNIWKRISYKGNIYGVYNEKEQEYSTYLLINAEKVKDKPDFMNEGFFDVKKLCKWINEYKNISEPALYLLWNDLGEYYSDRFTNLGYIGVYDGLYMSEDGIFQNVWENNDVRSFWESMVELKHDGLLSCDNNEDYSEALGGNFLSMIIKIPAEIMDGDYLYLEDGKKIPVYSYKVSSRYINKMENDIHGVVTWSKYPEQSKKLLTLVNTDKKLANLISFGEEGKDYSLVNGKVVGEKHVSSYCPTKLANAEYSIYEADGMKNKSKYYYDNNEQYKMSPAAGFIPKKKTILENEKVLNEVDKFYQKLLNSDEKPKIMIDKFVKKLKKDNYAELLSTIQKQYDKWKRGRKK